MHALKCNQKTKSHTTSVVHSPTVPQNTACAVLLRSVARLSSRLPRPTFVWVISTSLTSCEIYSSCVARCVTRVSCSDEISISDFSAFLAPRQYNIPTPSCRLQDETKQNKKNILYFPKRILIMFKHEIILLREKLQLFRRKLRLNLSRIGLTQNHRVGRRESRARCLLDPRLFPSTRGRNLSLGPCIFIQNTLLFLPHPLNSLLDHLPLHTGRALQSRSQKPKHARAHSRSYLRALLC